MSMSRLIIVSNRLPFSIDKNEEQPVLRQSSGGLVSALVSYFEKTGTAASKFNEHIWIGSVDFSPQDWENVSDQSKTSDFTVEPIFIDDEMPDNDDNVLNRFTIMKTIDSCTNIYSRQYGTRILHFQNAPDSARIIASNDIREAKGKFSR